MSIELHVFLDRKKLPSSSEWSKRLQAASIDISIDPSIKLEDQGGFMPVLHKGSRTGFELDVGEIEDWAKENEDLAAAIQERDCTVNFRFIREDELAAAYPSALVLARDFNGVFYDPQEGSTLFQAPELDRELASYSPNYWLSQKPKIHIVKNRQPGNSKELKLAIKDAAKLYKKFESAITPASEGAEDLIVEGVPFIELFGITMVALKEITESGPNTRNIAHVALSIQAIDRVADKLNEKEQVFVAEMRELCVQVLGKFGFEPNV